MPSGRKPEKDSKIAQLIFRAKPGQEEKVRWFKEWCFRNGKTVGDVLYEKVEEVARQHGFPNGHSQANLDFIEKPSLLPLYMTCRYGSKYLSGGEFTCKQDHLSRSMKICELRNMNGKCYREMKK